MPVPPGALLFDSPVSSTGVNEFWRQYIIGWLLPYTRDTAWDGTDADKQHATQQIHKLIEYLK